MDNNQNRITATISLEAMGFIVFIIFLILKLVGVTTMSWFWVFFPLWIPIAFSLALVVVILIVAAIYAVIKTLVEKHRNK